MNETAQAATGAQGAYAGTAQAPREGDQIPAVPFIGYAYGFIFVALLTYVLYVSRGLARVRGEIAELRRKLERHGAGG